MSLSILFTNYNKQIYGKRIRVADKDQNKFHKIEKLLVECNIELEDYALTTFTARIHIARKIGFLPANVFLSKQSLEHYVTRLEAGCEVTKKKEYSLETDYEGMELDYGNCIINNILFQWDMTPEQLEVQAGVMSGWSNNPHRTPGLIAKCAAMLCQIKGAPTGSNYQQIGEFLLLRKLAKEARNPKQPRLNPPEASPPQKKDYRFWRHRDEASEDEDK